MINAKKYFTVGVKRLPIWSSLGEHNRSDDRGGAGVQEHVGLLVAGVGWEEVLDKLVLHKPGLGAHIEPDEDIGQGLEEEEADQGQHGDEGEEVPGGFPLGQLVMRSSVANEEDGDGSQANVSN